MNQSAFKQGLAILFAQFPHLEPKKDCEFILRSWEAMFKDLPDDTFLNAISQFVMTTPKLFQYDNWVALVRQIAAPILPETEGDCVELAFEAVSKYGYMNEDKAMAWIEEKSALVAACIRRIGYQNICRSEEPDVLRGQLRAVFKAEKERAKQFGGVVNTAQDFIGGQPKHERLTALVDKIGKTLRLQGGDPDAA